MKNILNKRKITKCLALTLGAFVLMGMGLFFETVPKYVKYKNEKAVFVNLKKDNLKLEGDYEHLNTLYTELSADYDELKTSPSGLLVLIKIAYDDEDWEKTVSLVDEFLKKFPDADESESAIKMKKYAERMLRLAEEEKEKKKYESGVTYKNLAEESEKYKGSKVHFKGRVIQAMESGNNGWIRLAVNNDKNGVLIAQYNRALAPDRIYADEYVTIYGEADGLFTYTSTGGKEITIPKVKTERIGER